MKVKINEEACIGCGACEAIAPEIFELNDERISTCKDNNINDDLHEKVQDAIDSCPTGAIIENESEELKEN